MAIIRSYQPRKESGHRLRGLGDAVHVVAQPIAKVIDAAIGTKISTCGGCARRRERLNTLVPFK